MSVIRVENLNKSIKGKGILEDLSFTVERGDCLALIGPNGAGKTTLMNCLLGDMKATSGIIEVEGKAPGHPQLKASVSYLPQGNGYVHSPTLLGDCWAFKGRGCDHCLFFALHRGSRAHGRSNFGLASGAFASGYDTTHYEKRRGRKTFYPALALSSSSGRDGRDWSSDGQTRCPSGCDTGC